jgi:NAD(P)-dependent dehydrogenase (short-subunit alcohol dehydrogenase family)
MSPLDPKRDRIAVVTGAGTGIGRAIAEKFGALGWSVAVGGRRAELLDETAARVERAGGRPFAHLLDVTDPASVDAFFDRAEEKLGRIDLAINNAASARYGPFDEFSPQEIHAEIATKLTGGLYVARRAVHSMRATGRGGDILFMTSSAGAVPWVFHLPYAAANAGVEHAARIMRHELEGTGIRVNVLRCGDTLGTDFATRELASGRMAAANELWFRRGLLRHAGLMTPEMVADAVVSAVTLPMTHQLEIMALIPTAPIGALPATYPELLASYLAEARPASSG